MSATTRTGLPLPAKGTAWALVMTMPVTGDDAVADGATIREPEAMGCDWLAADLVGAVDSFAPTFEEVRSVIDATATTTATVTTPATSPSGKRLVTRVDRVPDMTPSLIKGRGTAASSALSRLVRRSSKSSSIRATPHY